MNNHYTWGDIQIEACKKMFLNNNNIDVLDLPSMRTDNKFKWYLNAMPHAANEAIYEILKRGKKHTKQYAFSIMENKGLLIDKKEPFEVMDDLSFDAEGAKAYYFEINNKATVNIYVDDTVVKTISVDTVNKYEEYKGIIENANNGTVKIEFEQNDDYMVRNLGLYKYSYPDDESVPANKDLLIIDLQTATEDYYKIVKVYYQDNTSYQELINNTDYQMLNNHTVVFDNNRYGNYIIEYQNYPNKITLDTPDTEEINLEPETAALIPLYIASQLYKDDDISIATTYRNEFEAAVENTFRMLDDLKFISKTGWL